MAKMGFEKQHFQKKMGNQVLMRQVGDKTYRFRSKAEYNWALYCQFRLGRGQIQQWEYEPFRIQFKDNARNPRSYLPDFWILDYNGKEWIEEVKGWLDGPTRSKCRKWFKERDEPIHLVLLAFTKRNAHGRRLVSKYCERIIDMRECLKNLKGVLPFE